MTLHRKIIFLILFASFLSSVQCKYKKMKWCINSDYVDVNGNIVSKESCRTRPCIVSSCPYTEMNFNKTCYKMADLKFDFSEILTLYKIESGKPVRTSNKLDNEHFQIVTYANKSANVENVCTSRFLSSEKFIGYFLDNGSFLLLPDTILPAGEYVVRFATKKVDGKLYPELRLKFGKDDQNDPDEILKEKIFGCVMLASCFFIILLLVVYALCKDLRTTPGIILMAFLAAFGINFLLLTIREFSLINQTLKPKECYTLSVLIRFFTLNSYCWMSIMSFNIWWTLRGMFYNHTSPGKNVDYRKFARYCCVTLVISSIYVVVEVCLNEFTESYSPKFSRCTANSSVWHLGAVLLPLLVLNCVLFVMTVYNLCRIQRSTHGELNNSSSGRTGPAKQTALIIIKISMMMGINWFIDLLVLFFDNDIPKFVQYSANMYNCSIGVIMFLMNIIKADVLLKLFRKLSINNGITRHLERRVSKQHSNKSKSSQRSRFSYVVNSQPDPE